jgi:hypothetical protein
VFAKLTVHVPCPILHVCALCRRFALESELRREGLPEDEQLKILGELEKRESDFTRLQRARLTADDFEPLTIIGRGAFGEVCGNSWGCLGLGGVALEKLAAGT